MAYFRTTSDIKATLAENLEYQATARSRIKSSNALAEALLRRKHAAEEAKINKKYAKIEAKLSDHSGALQVRIMDENAAYLAETVTTNAKDRASVRKIDKAHEDHADGILEAYGDFARKVEELVEKHDAGKQEWATDVDFKLELQALNAMVNDKLIEHNRTLKQAQRASDAYKPGMSPAQKPRVVKARGKSTITRNKTMVKRESLQIGIDEALPSSRSTTSNKWRKIVKNQETEIYEQKIVILDPGQAAALDARVREIQDKVRQVKQSSLQADS